jgi:hypothetical protein
MIRDDATPTDRPPRPERRDDAPDPRCDRAERFRATARHIATQLDIEAAMWQLLGKDDPNA